MISYDIIEHGEPLQKVLRRTPEPGPGEILMRITHSGVCHSDVHIWDGYFDLGADKRSYVKDRGCVPPFTLGHEPLGIVQKVGEGVNDVSAGHTYLVYPWIGCGRCAVCESGQENFCVTAPQFIGAFRSGAYASHLLVPDAKYLVDVSGIDEGFAATLACSGLTAYSASAKLPALSTRDYVAVVGCGGLGLVCISILRAKGVRNIVACDIDDAKLAAPCSRAAASFASS
ncbi:alcohol dehydrogenase catalytic domain-containing protein, partial [Cupriavidus sp. TA19]|uniref:alcohol dehydrogenase catalytic domain-containing protein n=1 Tax=Cupriavidus sp. TA19 TaxID=701108 RepID=UPI00295F2527